MRGGARLWVRDPGLSRASMSAPRWCAYPRKRSRGVAADRRAAKRPRSQETFGVLRRLADWWLIPILCRLSGRARAAAARLLSAAGSTRAVVLAPDSVHLAPWHEAALRLPWVADSATLDGLHHRTPPRRGTREPGRPRTARARRRGLVGRRRARMPVCSKAARASVRAASCICRMVSSRTPPPSGAEPSDPERS